jgi:hypothetical protein
MIVAVPNPSGIVKGCGNCVLKDYCCPQNQLRCQAKRRHFVNKPVRVSL